MYQENLDSNFKKMIFDAAKMYRKHRIRTKPKCAVYEPVGNAIVRQRAYLLNAVQAWPPSQTEQEATVQSFTVVLCTLINRIRLLKTTDKPYV